MAILTKKTKVPRQTQKIIILLKSKRQLNMKVSRDDWAQFLHLASQSGLQPPAPFQFRHCVSPTKVQAWDVSCVVFADLEKVLFHV